MDRVICDFLDGAAEKLVLANQHHEVIVIEGQGSLFHPRYSCVTLGLLHGVMPDGLILCYEMGRKEICGMEQASRSPSLERTREFYEAAAGVMHPCRVIGVAINSHKFSDDEAAAERRKRAPRDGPARLRRPPPRPRRAGRRGAGAEAGAGQVGFGAFGVLPVCEAASGCLGFHGSAAMELILHRFELPLRHAFTIARGSTTVSRTLVVELRQDGVSGYGEAGENAYYGATLENMTAALEAVRPELEAASLDDPAALWQRLAPRLADEHVRPVRAGPGRPRPVGQAPRAAGLEALGPAPRRRPAADRLHDRHRRDRRDGRQDGGVRRLADLQDQAGHARRPGDRPQLCASTPTPRFGSTPTARWTADETIRNAPLLAELGVEFIEQPLPPDDREGMQEVYRRSVLPVVADESCRHRADVDRCGGLFHGVNVKLVKCGGLTPARACSPGPRQLGLKTMVGCMTESSVGISAIAQLLPHAGLRRHGRRAAAGPRLSPPA